MSRGEGPPGHDAIDGALRNHFYPKRLATPNAQRVSSNVQSEKSARYEPLMMPFEWGDGVGRKGAKGSRYDIFGSVCSQPWISVGRHLMPWSQVSDLRSSWGSSG